ncbi:MAG: hypothetical protein E7384_05380 [Ruminococcaceae bacterium]|nr:hypothetical protein [Oscillospiraceae bacterium]
MKALILNNVNFDFNENRAEPEIFARIGLALGEFFGTTSTVAIGCESDIESLAAVNAVSAGLMFYGINVKIVEETVLPVLRWMCRQGICDGGVYISGVKSEKICILNNRGNDITSDERKKFARIFIKKEFADVLCEYSGSSEKISAPEEFYTAYISGIFLEAYRCLCLDMKNIDGNIKNIVCAFITSELFPNAPIFVPEESYLAVSKVLGKHPNIIRCGSYVGDIMAEMERFIRIPGVYEQYLMMFDDFAFEIGLSHYKALKGLDRLRSIVIPRIYRKNIFIDCDECEENELLEYIGRNKALRKCFKQGEFLLHNDDDGYVMISVNSGKKGIDIDIECYREEYAEDISAELNEIISEYKGKKA